MKRMTLAIFIGASSLLFIDGDRGLFAADPPASKGGKPSVTFYYIPG